MTCSTRNRQKKYFQRMLDKLAGAYPTSRVGMRQTRRTCASMHEEELGAL